MQKRWQAVIIALTLLLTAASVLGQQCIPPTNSQLNGQLISSDTLLCPGMYTLPAGLRLAAGVALDCGNATLQGSGSGTGVLVEGDGAQLQHCFIRNYAVGISVRGTIFQREGVTFADNGLNQNQVAGEDITFPTTDTSDAGQEPPFDQPTTVTQGPAAPSPTTTPGARNASIWEVADVTSERLLENALQFEYDTDTVPAALLAERVGRLQQTLQDVRIEREFIYRNGQTHVRIRLKPARGFFRRVVYENITLYDYIPKCFAELVGDVVFDGEQPQALVPDPLLKKVLPRNELTFSYSRPLAVSERCQELFRIIGVGDGRQVQTLGSVLASEGIGAVVTTFPLESVVIAVLLCSMVGAGIMFKRSVEKVRR